ncbi:RraA family protein [Enterocloster asparagiformis]|uniref:RraA family protein n=1 Tax=Enterocloster asparagiformis TaxID=333367 RepID=UPI002A7F6E3A|nr:RraA family protein [Enterocloster asparagiformis]
MEIITLPGEIIAAFEQMDTPGVSDAMDRLGIPCALFNIKPIVPGTKLCGQAFTVHYTACGQMKGTVGDFLDDVQPGQVVVIDNGGRLDCTVWGDIMSICAAKKGIAGTVIDGVCRDLPVIRRLGYPVFSKGYYMSTGKDRVYVDRINAPVTVSGLQILPGDLLLADDSGAVVIPRARATEILKTATEIARIEDQIVAQIQAGCPLKKARAKLGYHTLQTRAEER